MAIIISEQVTRKLIDMPRALTVVEKVFRDCGAGKVSNLPRSRLRGSQRRLNILGAWHADWNIFALRFYMGGTNAIALCSGRTGQFQALVNGSYLSSLRTGAASGVAAKYLCSPRAQVLGVIGTGWQATFQIEAIALSAPVQKVLVYGRNPLKKRQFVRKMRRVLHVKLEESSSLEELETRSDIIVLATNSTVPILYGNFLKDEVLVISMGANQLAKHEVSGDLIRRMDLVVTDDLPAAQRDSGDLIGAHEAGILQWENVVSLDWIVARGKLNDRPKKILFQSNGIAIEDLAVGTYVLRSVRRKRIKVRNVPEI